VRRRAPKLPSAARSALARAALGVIALAAPACGSSTPTEPQTAAAVDTGATGAAGAPAPAPPPVPKTRDALERAVRLVNARAGAIIHVAAWRGHPLAGQILEAMPLRGTLERSGIDPMNDVDRVLIASADPRQRNAVAVYEHHVDAARLDRLLLEAMRDSSPPGEALREGSMSGARVNLPVSVRGRQTTLSGDIWLATPTLLVVVPPRMPGASTFQQSAGLPMPSKNEGGSGWTEQPAEVFRNSRVDIPSTLSRADAWTFPQPGGGVRAEVRARSTSHDQALSDANKLTGDLDRATRVKVGPLTVRVFQTPQFRAEGDEVVGEIDVSRGQLEQVLSMAEREADRY
jgi:hypothetical protein